MPAILIVFFITPSYNIIWKIIIIEDAQVAQINGYNVLFKYYDQKQIILMI